MQILIFSRRSSHWITEIEAVAGDAAADVVRTADEAGCKRALSGCMDGESILVFFISGPEDMAFLETEARQFIDMKLIIYLEDHDPELTERAFRLKPRLVIDSRDNPALLPGAVGGILAGLMAYKNRLTP